MTPAELRSTIDALGWSQARLARAVGTTPRAISRYATGKQPVPPPIAAYLALLSRLHAAGLSVENQ